jgi:hypothetical protein
MSAAAAALPLRVPDLERVVNRAAIYPQTSPTGRWNPKAEGLRHLGLFDPLPHWLAIRRLWQDRLGNVRRVNASTKLCYAAMLRLCGPDGTLVISLPKLAAAQGMSARQVHRILADLEEIGLIVRDGQRGNNLPAKYQFLAHEWMLGEPEQFAAPTPVAQRTQAPRPHVALQPDLPDLFPAACTSGPVARPSTTYPAPPPTVLPYLSAGLAIDVKTNR